MKAEAAPIWVRAASAGDQSAIESLVRRARINPLGLHWQNFLVAEEATLLSRSPRLVGIGQIKVHRDGSRELASIAVEPERQRSGLAALLIHELLRRERDVVYLYCGGTMPAYYRRFGFEEIAVGQMPRPVRPLLRVGQLAALAIRTLTGREERLTAMRRAATRV